MFDANEFKDVEYNPAVIPVGVRVLDYYKRLQRIPEFLEDIAPLDIDKVLRYIICMYSINSPFLTIDNLMHRKMAAASYAGFSTDKKLISRGYQEVLYGKNKLVNKMIIRFCRMSHSMNFMKLMILEESIYLEYLAFTDMDSNAKAKTLLNIEKMELQLQNITRSMFYGVDERLEQDVLEVVELERELELRPEDYARKVKEPKPRASMDTIPEVPANIKHIRTAKAYEPSGNVIQTSVTDYLDEIELNSKDIPDAAKETGYNQA